MKKSFLFFCILLTAFCLLSSSSSYAQTPSDFGTLLNQARAGTLPKMTYEQFQNKLKEYNITEEEARKRAKDQGVDIDNLLIKEKPAAASQQPGVSVQVNVPAPGTPSATTVPAPEAANVTRDIAPAPKGPQNLDYFGYDLFKIVPAAFEPSAVGPVDPGYLLSAGDVLRLTVWGQAEFTYELEVDRGGRIFIPNVGAVFVLGTPLRDLEHRLKSQLSKYYSGLVTAPPRVFMDVTITKLRPVRVFIMGEVKQPGGYTISSYATVFNALYAVGGLLTRGSLRTIRVLRDNSVVATVDLYDYLLRGDKSSDVRLQNNDLIFVPPRGKSVGIRGEVHRPAIYELRDGEDLRNLVQLAGGILSTAYLDHAQIDRVRPFEERTKGIEDRLVVDINLGEVLKVGGKAAALFDADEVQVFPILDEKRNFVSISGSVWRPGRYELGKIERLKDLITAAEGLKPETYVGKVDIERIRPDLTREFLTVSLSKALEGDNQANIILRPKDGVRVYSIHEIEFEKTISISGYVKTPMTIPYADSLTLYDMVFKAGGLLDPEFRKNAYLERADLVRLNSDMITKRIIPFSLQRLMDDSTYNVKLQPRDEILVYAIDVTEFKDKYVTIDGHVKNPGRYPFRSNMALSDLVLLAGGYTEDASVLQAEVSRIRPEGLQGDTLAILLHPKLTRDLARKVADYSQASIHTADSSMDDGRFRLQHRDKVSILPNPGYKVQQNVSIEGDFIYPGIYTIRHQGERISEILARAGGPTKSSYLEGGQYLRGGQRIIIDLAKVLYKGDKGNDILVMDGDRLSVPRKPYTVLVTGEVNKPGLFAFLEGDDVFNYINRAGGLTDSAYYAMLSAPSGESRKIGFGIFAADPDVLDGSTIDVRKRPPEPPEEKKIDWGATIKDVFALAASAATIIYLVYQTKK